MSAPAQFLSNLSTVTPSEEEVVCGSLRLVHVLLCFGVNNLSVPGNPGLSMRKSAVIDGFRLHMNALAGLLGTHSAFSGFRSFLTETALTSPRMSSMWSFRKRQLACLVLTDLSRTFLWDGALTTLSVSLSCVIPGALVFAGNPGNS